MSKRDDIHDDWTVVVRPLPNIVFFYTSWLASLACLMLQGVFPDATLGIAWMLVFSANLVIISFDFTLERALMLLFIGIGLGVWLFFYGDPTAWFAQVKPFLPTMNRSFYGLMFAFFSLLYFGVWLIGRFNYWEFKPHEVVQRQGLLGRTKRYAPDSIRWDKYVPDVLERLLLGTGTLVITTAQEAAPIVLENVPSIGTVDDEIARVMAIQVTVQEPPPAEQGRAA